MRHKSTFRSSPRRSPQTIATLSILAVSFAVALGGAYYWDSVQQKDGNEMISVQEEEKENMDAQDPPAPKEKSEEPAAQPEEQTPTTVVAACDWVDSAYFTDAAFVGDSLTQGIQLYEIMDTNVVANRGINLSSVMDPEKIPTANGPSSVFKELERIQPKKIYILLGANDISWRDETNFKNAYGNLVDEVKKQHPDALLYLQSMLPVTEEYSNKDNGISNEKLTHYNELILQIAEEKGAYYLDVASCLRDESGALPSDVSPDGMHLNAPTYRKWFDYLKTHVVQEA